MKKNPSYSVLIAVVLFCLSAFSSNLSAQTPFSGEPDLKKTTSDLDHELEKALDKDKASEPALEIAEKPKKSTKPAGPNLFAKSFYPAPSKKSESIATDVLGFTVMHTPSRKMDAEYAIVTGFGGEVVKTRFLPGLKTIDEVNDYIQNHMESSQEGKVEIRKLPMPNGGPTYYWVGDKAFNSPEEAKQMIDEVQKNVTAVGGDFESMVSEAQVPVEVEGQYVTMIDQEYIPKQKKEEDLILKWADQMDIGEELWGPFHGDPTGEQIVWQSFGETSYRSTNLEDNKFNSQVGYWSNRVVMKGIRFPLNTLDPFVESTVTMEAVPEDYKSFVDFYAGVEWRPLARNHWLMNYRPIGNIKILEWVRNYRFYVKYGDRKNIKDEISAYDWDYQAGVQLFYEFGTDLPALNQPAPETFPEYLEEIVWGEYFADYHYQKTGFSIDKNDGSWIMGNSLMLGIKMPGIPLPENPINNELMFMPYVHLNSTINTVHNYFYQNYWFLSAGVRWMPFRTYRHKENEWLSKVKVFAEWLAIGKTQYTRTPGIDNEPDGAVRNDLRFGVSFASRRY